MLRFGCAEWDALPWHEQRMYLEELAADMGETTGVSPPGPSRSDGHPHHPLVVEDAEDTDPVPPAEPGRRAGRAHSVRIPRRVAYIHGATPPE